ncbi:MAG: thioredoxin-dependent thiol peroxidase [Bacteroidales bacterium]|jgi:peroxiredoxin Q/BCP|nr:thioredoxin-dependent thiol peroxidase [Bacteroidales bacterium]
MTLQKGDKAPLFMGINQNGKEISLSEFKGKKVILYFYPKDNTSGCTAEACSLNDKSEYFLYHGFVIIGVSPDSVESHRKFGEKYNLNFNLISDPEKVIIKQYGAWGVRKDGSEGLLRTTFIIGDDGLIEQVIPKVDTANHAEQIIELLK